MNYTEEAIKKAVGAGWDRKGTPVDTPFWEIVTSDLSFWQSLGKALVWKDNCGASYIECLCGVILQSREATYEHIKQGHLKEPLGWKKQWHRFIDHLAEGKKAEEYFKEILS